MTVPETLHELVAAQAARVPAAVAVRQGEERLTYADLDAAADRLAGVLRAHGAGPEKLVGVCLQRSVRLPVVLLAVLKAGAAYLPLDPAYPEARLRALIADAGPVLIVSDPRSAPALPDTPGLPVLSPDTDGPGSDGPAAGPENLAFVLHTSGSTGVPRAVAVPHRAVLNLVRAGTDLGFGPDEVFLHLAPLAFDASTFELWGPLTHGSRVALLPREHPTPAELGAVIRREGVTTLWLTAGLFHQLAEDGLGDLRGLRHLLTGGDVVRPAAVRRAMAELPGCRISNGYGPTEATTFTTTQRLDDTNFVDTAPIGRAIAGVTVHVLDERLRPAETGELYVAGAGLSRGYRNSPALTAAKFLPDPFAAEPGARMYRTGDRARRRPDGVLEFLGRVDNQLKLRGFRIEPGEIEHVLREYPGVSDAVVVPRSDRLVAYTTGPEPADPAELRGFVAQRLPDFMVPAAIVPLPRFPLNANGKVDRRALPEPPPAPAGRAAGTPAEEVLAGSLARILGVDRVGVDDGFFALGVNSLQVMRWLTRIRAAFGVDLSVRDVFTAATVSDLAARLSHSDTVTLEPLPGGDFPLALSFAQEQLWLLDQVQRGNTGYAVPLLFRLRGPLDADALARALVAVVDRHEPLHTVFAATEGKPRAVAGTEPFTVDREDLSGLPPDERERRLGALLAQDARTPFDLARGPLVRGRVIRLGPAEHVLAVTVHHIACDGWSMAVLRHEIGRHYRAAPLPAPPVRYRDYVHWQRSRLSPEALAPARAYWSAALAGAETLTLPMAGPRPAVARHRGRSFGFTLPGELAAALRELARERDATLFMVLLAGFQALLSRYSGQRDICVGVPVAGRDRPEFDGLIGYFVNLLVFRGDLRGDPAFGELLARTRESTLDAYEHRQLPFDRLVDLLGADREPGRNPVVQVAFAWQNTPFADLELPGVDIERLEPEVTGTKFDLTLSLEETGTGLRGTLDYDQDLFAADAMDRLVDHYETLLAGAARSPGARLSELPVLTGSELGQLAEWNAVAPSRAAGADAPTVTELVAEWVRRTPAAIAISGDGRELTYAELDAAADRFAAVLRANGAGPEKLVGVCLRRSVRLPVVLLAVLRTGAAYLPLDPDYPLARLEFMLADAAPALLVATADTRTRLPAEPGVPVLDPDHAQPGPAGPGPQVGPDDLAYVMYTSGSTGTPKGVAVPHRGITRLVTDETAFRLRGETLLLLAPFAFDASTFEIWGALANGGRVAVFPDGRSPLDGLGAVLRAERVTTCFLATALFHEIAGTDLAQLRPLRQLLVGGDVLAPVTAARAVAGLPECQVVNVYGPTETVTFCAAHRLDRDSAADPVPIGRPLAGGPLHVLDAEGNPVPVGVRGELHVGGVAVSRGYLGRPGLTAERFVPGPAGERLYRTGDLVRRRRDGALEFLGRADGQVKISGFRVEVGEIEAVLRGHPAVRDAVVTVLGRDAAARKLVASVVATPGADLRAHLAERLPGYLVPSRITVLAALPVGPAGKVDRAAVAAAERELPFAPGAPEPAPDDTLAAGLAGIWQEVLGWGPVGADRNFFDAGGNSLLLARVHAAVRDRLGHDVPMVELFRYPTVSGLAAHLRRSGEPAPVESTVDTSRPRLDAGRDRMARLRARRTSGPTPARGD